MSPKFQVYKDVAGKTRFRLRANNNEIIAVGEAYEQHASCINGIRSVQRNCRAAIEDLTMPSNLNVYNPKYQLYKDDAGKFRFRLKAANGEIIAQDEGYESKEGCLNGIQVVKDCSTVQIEDPYAPKKPLPKEFTEKNKGLTLSQLSEAKAESQIPEIIPEASTQPAPVLPVKEVIEEPTVINTVLELQSLSSAARGDKVTFQGRLFNIPANKAISGAKIRIYKSERSIIGDDYLAFGYTQEDGSFSISWKARSISWLKDSGNIYAKFDGNEKAKPTRSTIQTVTIKQ